MTYARDTEVPPDRSRAEIERTLRRYGATHFLYGYDQQSALIGFVANDRQIKFIVPLPDRDQFSRTATGKQRVASAVEQAWEQAQRQRWRALALAIKAKLEVVESGIATFEDEFMAYVVLPNGQTVGQYMTPQIEQAYDNGAMPQLLPMLGAGR